MAYKSLVVISAVLAAIFVQLASAGKSLVVVVLRSPLRVCVCVHNSMRTIHYGLLPNMNNWYYPRSTRRRDTDSCVQCDSRESPACANQSLHLQPSECANATAYGCFSRVVDGHTVRGCLGALAGGVDECASSSLCNSCYNVNNAQGCNNQVGVESLMRW